MFYYDEQHKQYLLQFAAIFSEMFVKIGANEDREERLIPVEIHYGSKDRAAHAILAGNTQNKPVRLPNMSMYISSIDLAPERRKGVGIADRHTHLPRGGLLPDDVQVVHRLMPVPYNMSIELAIFTSNQDQHMQILEQILMLFDPTLQIQLSDSPFDWKKITQVELQAIRFDENYPIGTDRRMIQTSLDFKVPIYIAPPAQIKQDYVEKIKMRISATDLSTSLADIVTEFDELGIEYTTVVSTDDLV